MTAKPGPAAPVTDRRAIPAHALESRWLAPDGYAIRRIDWPEPSAGCKGSLLFLPGRGDAYEKYLETLEYWHQAGWRTTSADWRGQAGSGRLGRDPLTGHITDFSQWVSDLAAFWAEWKASTPPPHVLAGHSMGGHLVLRALAEGKVDPDAAVLVAPMLGFRDKGVPSVIMHTAARLMKCLGDPRRPAWKWSEKPRALPSDRILLLTHDAERYADEVWWRDARPEIAMGPGSWGWVERAYASMRGLERPGVLERINTPVLIVATDDDRLVEFKAIERASRRLPRAALLRFGEEARHEILREEDGVRNKALSGIERFLANTLPPAC